MAGNWGKIQKSEIESVMILKQRKLSIAMTRLESVGFVQRRARARVGGRQLEKERGAGFFDDYCKPGFVGFEQ